MTADDRLSRIQSRALAALLTSRTILEAATTAGVSERTLRRWLTQPEFASTYRSAAREAASEAVSSLLAAQREAVDVLVACLHDGTPATRVRAARCLLELGVRVGETDVDERLQLLEREVRSWDTTPRLASVR